MPRKPDLPCADCGKMMWRRIVISLPQGEAKCNSCRRATWPGGRPVYRPGRTVPVEIQLQRMAAGRARLHDKRCPTCHALFQAVVHRVYCDTCRDARIADRLRRKGVARRTAASVTGERITITALGDRDRWTCHLCGEFVNRELSGRDPWMPSFDHVVPISRGGLDSWDNLRLAHLVCNVRCGDRELATNLGTNESEAT